MSKIDLDLDTIVKPKGVVKLNGKTFEVEPPTVLQLLAMTKKAMSLRNLDESDLSKDDILDKMNDVLGSIVELVPDMKEENLTLDQIFLLLDFLANMVVPSDVKELEKEGITLSNDQKKILSDH